ncbi:hypothetical protein AB0478_44015, partial [Streptomyces sp. NPDC051917]|uniref:hypothetical protein n=1 Tax=Streptomyces sp. NPDC051917 TaxID=3154754 RepID=UPI0034511357
PRLHALATARSPNREPAFDRHRSRSKRQQLLKELTERAAAQLGRVAAFLAAHSPADAAVHLSKEKNEWT